MKIDKEDKERELAFLKEDNENEEEWDLAVNASDLRKKFLDKYKKTKNSTLLDSAMH